MAPMARGLPCGVGPFLVFRGRGAVVFVWLFLGTLCTGTESGASGAAEWREGTAEAGWMKFYTAERAGGLGEGERRD